MTDDEIAEEVARVMAEINRSRLAGTDVPVSVTRAYYEALTDEIATYLAALPKD